MATQISVPGAHGVPPLIFTVSGVSTTNYAMDFQTALKAASASNSLKINVLSDGTAQSAPTAGTTTLNEIFSNTTSSMPYGLNQTGEYTLALVGSDTTINGATFGHDTVVAGGAVTFIESNLAGSGGGGQDNIDFISGTNLFVGNTASGDTVTGGSGYDTITTGTGATTVFSGSGNTLINLNDSIAGSTGDIAFLGDGMATVNAYGLADTVVAAAPGQTIFADGPDTANDTIVIGAPDSPGGPAGGDTLVLGAASVSVFDSVGGNSIFGGAGSLTFVAQAQTTSTTITDTVVNGSGNTYLWGANNDDITFASTSGSGSLTAVAGLGNETLNGANAGSFNFFGSNDTTNAASTNTTIVGGSGSDYFSTGTGNEVFVAGTGADVFGLNTVSGSNGADHITIYDFSAADSVSFNGQSQTDVNNAINSGTVTGNNLTITLSDNTTVTFVDTTSLNGHII